jgi:hypothetical protein
MQETDEFSKVVMPFNGCRIDKERKVWLDTYVKYTNSSRVAARV